MADLENLLLAVKRGSATAAQQLGLLESEVSGGLGARRGDAVAVLVDALSHRDRAVRFEAAWALASFQDDASCAVAPLVGLLSDPDQEVRSQAAETLGAIGITEQFLPQLIEALSDPDAVIRQSAAEAIASLGPAGRDAVPALTVALGDPDNFVRANAAMTLGEIGPHSADAVGELLERVLVEDMEAQTCFVEAIQRICQASQRAIDILREAIQVSGSRLRGAAAVALTDIVR